MTLFHGSKCHLNLKNPSLYPNNASFLWIVINFCAAHMTPGYYFLYRIALLLGYDIDSKSMVYNNL